jgi:hypothetical protein
LEGELRFGEGQVHVIKHGARTGTAVAVVAGRGTSGRVSRVAPGP